MVQLLESLECSLCQGFCLIEQILWHMGVNVVTLGAYP